MIYICVTVHGIILQSKYQKSKTFLCSLICSNKICEIIYSICTLESVIDGDQALQNSTLD